MPDPLICSYKSPVNPEQFRQDTYSYRGRAIYAVRVKDEVQVKLVFATFTSVFEFISSFLFNFKNTFLGSKKIYQLVAGIPPTATKTASVASQLTQTSEDLFKEKYYSFVEQTIPFLDGWLSNLKDLGKNADSEMRSYIKGELKAIRQTIIRKQREVKEFAPFKNNSAYKDAVKEIRKAFRALNDELSTFEAQLVPKKRGALPSQVAVPGIKNAGNSCYMNSALQGLLSSPLIIHRIKAYNKKDIPNHERFMPTLKEFLIAYQNNNSKAIGEYASKLRSELYHTRLKNLDVEHLYAMADADLIVMVLGETLNLEYPLITRRTATKAVAVDGTVINENFVSDVPCKQLLWNECKTSGAKGEPSLQERFNQDCVEAITESNLGWKTETKDDVPVIIDEASTAYRIAGPPPPILVFKVGSSQGGFRDDPFTPYGVQERDEYLDASKAFDTPPDDGAKYRLISVLINHGRAHWTAMSRREGGWYNCNDSSVNYIGTELPQVGAAVMIYELVKPR